MKFLKSGKVVVILRGRYAGRKAVIVEVFDEGTAARPYGHAIVVGIHKYPKPAKDDVSAEKNKKRTSIKCFVQVINYRHFMPTRYNVDVEGLTSIVKISAMEEASQKKAMIEQASDFMTKHHKSGKHKWFFTKLVLPQ